MMLGQAAEIVKGMGILFPVRAIEADHDLAQIGHAAQHLDDVGEGRAL